MGTPRIFIAVLLLCGFSTSTEACPQRDSQRLYLLAVLAKMDRAATVFSALILPAAMKNGRRFAAINLLGSQYFVNINVDRRSALGFGIAEREAAQTFLNTYVEDHWHRQGKNDGTSQRRPFCPPS